MRPPRCLHMFSTPKLIAFLIFATWCTTISWPGEAAAQTSRAAVRIDGSRVLHVSAETREEARERADQIERRLNRLLNAPESLAPLQVTSSGEARLLSMAGLPILEVTHGDSADSGADPDKLAVQWKLAIEAALKRAAERRLSGWGRFAAETRASVQTAFGRLLESAIYIVPRLLAGITVLLLFWALAAFVRAAMRLIFSRVISDLTVENLIRQIAYYAVWAVGLIVATSALGFDPQALATGLGLTGVALGFALKDILSNFVAGVLILWMRPFEIGDQIVIGETEGSVERITLRATQIRTYDGRAVLVPNSEVFTSRLTNNTESPVRRGSVELPLGYASDVRSTVEVLQNAVCGAPGVLHQPPPSVRIRELNPDDMMLEVRFWTDSRRSDFLLTSSHVRDAVVGAMKRNDIALPEPSARTVSVRIVQTGQDTAVR